MSNSSYALKNDLYHLTNEKIPDENNERILRNSLLFPISKAFLEDHPQYDDVIRNFEAAVEKIPQMLEFDKDATVNTFLKIDEKKIMHLKINFRNIRLFSPNTAEAIQYMGSANMISPNMALSRRQTYSLVMVGDLHYEYLIINKNEMKKNKNYLEDLNEFVKYCDQTKYTTGIIPDGYVVGIPIMIGCKWCTTRNFDLNTLIRSGEDVRGLYGMFIIEGYLRYLQGTLKKPLNKPIILHNDYDHQCSRCEIQYSKSTEDYQNSYYIVAAMMDKMKFKTGNKKEGISTYDFGFSLQLNHPTMVNQEKNSANQKSLANFIPIKLLFAAFGCTNDRDLLNYVCPDGENKGLMTIVKMATQYGWKHYEAYVKSKAKLEKTEMGNLKLAEPLTEFYARYLIGMIIMKEDILNNLQQKSNGNEEEFRQSVKMNVDTIFAERFMPAIGDPETGSNVDRNTAICITIGNIVRELYMIGMNLRESQSKQTLTNKRYHFGQPFIKEFKSFHGVRLNTELIPMIKNCCLANSDRSEFPSILRQKIEECCQSMSRLQTASMIQSFKVSNGIGNQSKIRNEILESKNQIFIWNKLREITKNQDAGSKVRESWENRRQHPSEMFFLCPTESPDSANVAKNRALAIHTRTVIITPSKPILDYFNKNVNFKRSVKGSEIKKYYTVSLNGSIIGYLEEFDKVENAYKDLMLMRRNGTVINDENKYTTIPCDLTVVLNNHLGKLDIWCDTGRLSTPFVIVKNCFDLSDASSKNIKINPEFIKWLESCNKEVGKFNEGIKKGFIEMLDCEMIAYNMVIAASIREFYENPLKYTHISMNSSMDGIVIAANPTSSLNLGTRSGMASNHLKQAMGSPSFKYPQLTFQNLMDILVGGQQPIIQPCFYQYAHLNKVPIGENVTICFCQMKYNQEDSVIFNRESVERGLLKCDTLTLFKSSTIKSDEKFQNPVSIVNSLSGNPLSYNKLGEVTCLPKEISQKFGTHDALITKIKTSPSGTVDLSEINNMPDAQNTINPRPMRCIEKHYIHENDSINKYLVTGQYRVLISGDKVNQETAQKGTVGKIIDPECLPYTSTGRRADIYFNPLSILKRKTYATVYLSNMMKIAALHGVLLENSTYGTCRTPEEIVKIYQNMKLNDAGFETMFDPETGEIIKGLTYFGMSYYERQHHLVESKQNIRNHGSKDPVYNLPPRGKNRAGGPAFDPYSVTAMGAAGVNYINDDFHYNQGSKMEIGFCKLCKNVMCYKKTNKYSGKSAWVCPNCGEHSEIIPRFVSCSFPLLQHIFKGLHLGIEYFEDM